MPTGRRALRAQIVVLVVAALVAALGAAIWSRTVASDDDPVAAEDDIRLSEPGVYIDPTFVNPDHGGEAFPSVTLARSDGRAVELALDGRPTVVNIWNTTCGPCSRELWYFAELDRELGGSVRFVGVDPLPADADGRMEEFASARGVGYELYLDDRYELFDALGVVGFPLTLFVAADGTIVAQAGEVSEAELRDHVARLLP
jgi:thiol-disulfide isomerase/thioredoxin